MKSITVEIKDQYGNKVFYPACEDAMRFAAIAGTTTLTERVLMCVKGLGYDITYTYSYPKGQLP
jgi:hypothetical protein